MNIVNRFLWFLKIFDIYYQGEICLRTEDILSVLAREGHSIALVMLGGVHYYTGQLLDIETITRVAHEQVRISVYIIFCILFLRLVGLLRWLGSGACCR